MLINYIFYSHQLFTLLNGETLKSSPKIYHYGRFDVSARSLHYNILLLHVTSIRMTNVCG